MWPPVFRDLHSLPIAAHIRFKTMVLAFKAVNWTEPIYLKILVRPHTPAQALHYISGLAGTTITDGKQRSLGDDSSMFWRLSGGTNSQLMSGQHVIRHLPQKIQDSLVQTSPQPYIAW